MRSVLVVAALAVAAVCVSGDEFSNFDLYCKHFGKRYSGTEYAMRKAVFEARVRLIDAHNAGPSNYKQGVNALTDRTFEELKGLMGFSKDLQAELRLRRANQTRLQPLASLEDDPPASVDWTTKGVLTDVKNQGQCGSCWAFAGTEAIESAVFLATGKLNVLAPQAYVDCVPNPYHCGGSGGCEGATSQLLFKYAREHGAALESEYPYQGKDGSCKNFTSVASISGWMDVAVNNQRALMQAVAKQPVTISVAASQWPTYSSGVLSFDECDEDINHAVLLVGYGTDDKLGNYWKVQNSWGPTWGEGGFIRLARMADDDSSCRNDTTPGDGSGCTGGPSSVVVCGTCGMLSGSSYPTVAK